MEIEFTAYATTVAAVDGKFHPAVQVGSAAPKYWPNIKFATEEEAYEHAGLALKDAYEAANAISRAWNVVAL